MDLQVAPRYRGRGHGSSLLAAAEQLARDAGWGLIGLEVTVSNPHNDVARAMYQCHGFEDSGLGEFESGYFYRTESAERCWDGGAGWVHRARVRAAAAVPGPQLSSSTLEPSPSRS